MRKYTLNEIAEITGGVLLSGDGNTAVDGVSMDSRTAKDGELFIPLIGEENDGHKYIPSALENGCTSILLSEKEYADKVKSVNAVLVDDTRQAMHKLVADCLKKLNVKTVAVTGSVGKTSTRDMMYAIASEKYATGTSEKNYNTDVGIAHTVFSFEEGLEAAVLEVGMDKMGEIHQLVEIVRPDVAIITNVGTSHIEFLGSRENILKAKMEVIDFFGPDNTLVMNGDNDMLSTVKDSDVYKTVRVGSDSCFKYRFSDVVDKGEDGISYVFWEDETSYNVNLNVPGAHNALNSALAIVAGLNIGVTIEEAIRGLEKIRFTGRRLRILEKDGFKLIDDTYNASPESVKSAIKTLLSIEGKRKIAIFAGINELGELSDDIHYEVGKAIAEDDFDILYTQGDKVYPLSKGYVDAGGTGCAHHFPNKEELYKAIKGTFLPGDVIVVKASRGQKMEDVVEYIMNEQE